MRVVPKRTEVNGNLNEGQQPRYDYLLFVGPGRSATTYVYRMLKDHYSVAFPDIKESYYYRSPRRYAEARRRLHPSLLLGDVANTAYLDPQLPYAITTMADSGNRVLIVATLREHVSRASSMLNYATSRGKTLWRGGLIGLERHIVAKCLTPNHLATIRSAGADVVVLDFDVLTSYPTETLNLLAELCGIPLYRSRLPNISLNASEASRQVTLSALATGVSRVLRAAGLRGTLQRLKDSRRLHGLVFRPLTAQEERTGLGSLEPGHEEHLKRLHRECRTFIESNFELRAEGFYLTEARRVVQ